MEWILRLFWIYLFWNIAENLHYEAHFSICGFIRFFNLLFYFSWQVFSLQIQCVLSMFTICPVFHFTPFTTCGEGDCVFVHKHTQFLFKSLVVQQRSRLVNYGCDGIWEAVFLTFLWFITLLNAATPFSLQDGVGYLMWSFILTFAFVFQPHLALRTLHFGPNNYWMDFRDDTMHRESVKNKNKCVKNTTRWDKKKKES